MQPNGGLKTRNTLNRMVLAMVEHGDGCTAEDLKRKNFTPEEIRVLGPKAADLATARANAA
ncbi:MULTISPECIES: hypothetical protein [unclassified Ensifer]|uniref:hypothetical protein n=1 Tax=unclassified Ensifer TaxID=2633371 RepID=UPI0008134615|nr:MULTISPECIES: hypothetical protein [unclassified Ensifer]OCP05020.1 hypothetical protein BC362_14790 [Ensifer sp. LC14]OCP11821.1 hypothetical protein BC374_16215 [Ensifer sp. LC13]OCP12377.1 hypothetical protein BBX50_16410 [Ensifer sp. LC11]OCP33655.1 hypothetical protein BC364_15430 [Ensifer sp. LC499]